ncbi:MAG TPA: dihydropteroate synthase [Pseudomonadales bacterium]|nr:dihydropteroate synthase [Pseudomonadales bacterium]
MILRARHFEFAFPRPAIVMGIVNVTPDSFSDGGKYFNPRIAINHALKLTGQGAEILDIGGESTRPGARPVTEQEELRRVIPVIKELATAFKKRKQPPAISIDTMKPSVARAALEAGASIVNDVAANRENDEMWQVVSQFRAGYIVMHAPPGLHRKQSHREGMVRIVSAFFTGRLKKLKAAGIAPEQVVFDPGIGFGKKLEQNLQLLAGLRGFQKLHRPLLLGVSRKSFIEKLLGAKVNERLPASLACAILGIEAGAQIIRAHDVKETVQAIRMAETVLTKQKR